jgi:hypothetical protein
MISRDSDLTLDRISRRDDPCTQPRTCHIDPIKRFLTCSMDELVIIKPDEVV